MIEIITFQTNVTRQAHIYFHLLRSLTIEGVKIIIIDQKLMSNRGSVFLSKISRITWYHPTDSLRYENDEQAREESGFANSTFKTIFERIERESKEVRLSFVPIFFYWP